MAGRVLTGHEWPGWEEPMADVAGAYSPVPLGHSARCSVRMALLTAADLGARREIDAEVFLDVLEHPEGARVEAARDAERPGVLVVDHGVGSLVGHWEASRAAARSAIQRLRSMVFPERIQAATAGIAHSGAPQSRIVCSSSMGISWQLQYELKTVARRTPAFAIRIATVRRALGRVRCSGGGGEVVGPLLHERSAAVEQVAAAVGGLGAVVVYVGERELADLAGCLSALGGPVPKVGAEPGGHDVNAKADAPAPGRYLCIGQSDERQESSFTRR